MDFYREHLLLTHCTSRSSLQVLLREPFQLPSCSFSYPPNLCNCHSVLYFLSKPCKRFFWKYFQTSNSTSMWIENHRQMIETLSFPFQGEHLKLKLIKVNLFTWRISFLLSIHPPNPPPFYSSSSSSISSSEMYCADFAAFPFFLPPFPSPFDFLFLDFDEVESLVSPVSSRLSPPRAEVFMPSLVVSSAEKERKMSIFKQRKKFMQWKIRRGVVLEFSTFYWIFSFHSINTCTQVHNTPPR